MVVEEYNLAQHTTAGIVHRLCCTWWIRTQTVNACHSNQSWWVAPPTTPYRRTLWAILRRRIHANRNEMIKRKLHIIIFAVFIISIALVDCNLKNNPSIILSKDSVRIETKTEIKSDLIVKLYKLSCNNPQADSILDYLLINKQIIDTISEEEVSALTLVIDSLKCTLRFESYYKVGNSSSIVTEYRAIKLNNSVKLLHSKFVGTRAFTSQDLFEIYDYDSINNKLKTDTITIKHFLVSTKDFFSAETPDSIIDEFTTHGDNFYHIVYNTDGIAESIIDDHYGFSNMKENKWILGNTIRFVIKDDKIIRIGPFYEE